MTQALVEEEIDGLRIVSDPPGADRPDMVQGVTAAARTLANLLVPRRVRSALDLGCGSGFLALRLSRQAEWVVGTDVNPRAIEMARRSAALSGVRNAEWRAGDWYAPVQGERFDLIACNPPYVVSPETRLVFRDGSEATEGVVRAAARHLVPGGLAQFLVNWPHAEDDWVGPLRPWVPAGCDALVVHHASLRPRQYAETWAAPDRVDAWLCWYDERGIEAIGAAFLALRRRDDDGPPRLQALEAVRMPTPRAGLHVERLFAGADLAGREDFAGLHVAMVKGVRTEETADGALRVGVVPTVGVETVAPAALVAALDGTRPVGEVARDDAALTAARRLVELGLALPRTGEGLSLPSSGDGV
jgi:SAM-dependent methyltransferase